MECSPDHCRRLAHEVAALLAPAVESSVAAAVGGLRADLERLHGRIDGLAEAGAFRRAHTTPPARAEAPTLPEPARPDWRGVAALVVALATAIATLAGVALGNATKPDAGPPRPTHGAP